MRRFRKSSDRELKILSLDYPTNHHGWGVAIATSSMASELALGKPLEEVLKLTDQDIADELGGLPEDKMHCSLLAVTALHTGIMRYLAATGEIGQ